MQSFIVTVESKTAPTLYKVVKASTRQDAITAGAKFGGVIVDVRPIA